MRPLTRLPIVAALLFTPFQQACSRPGSAESATTGTEAVQATLTIDSVALVTELRALSADSMEGRATGSPGGEKARRYLDAAFAGSGLEPGNGDSFRQSFVFGDNGTTGINFIGRLPGRTAQRVMVVSAHYDHLGTRNGTIFNGADDNASGVSAILAIARAMRGMTPEHTILFVAMDAEENGLQGARAFVANPPLNGAAIAIDINLDMVSRNAAGELWAAGTHHYPALLPLIEALAERAPVKLRVGHDLPGTGSNDWTTSSDHGPFHAAGIPFLYFGVEDHPDYHRPTDDFESIDAGFYVRVVRTVGDAILTIDRTLESVLPISSTGGSRP